MALLGVIMLGFHIVVFQCAPSTPPWTDAEIAARMAENWGEVEWTTPPLPQGAAGTQWNDTVWDTPWSYAPTTVLLAVGKVRNNTLHNLKQSMYRRTKNRHSQLHRLPCPRRVQWVRHNNGETILDRPPQLVHKRVTLLDHLPCLLRPGMRIYLWVFKKTKLMV